MDKKQILKISLYYYRLGYKKLEKYHNAKLSAPYYTKLDYLSDLYLYLSKDKHFQKFDKSKMSLFRYMHCYIFPRLNNRLAAKTEHYKYKGAVNCSRTEWQTMDFCPVDNEDVAEQLIYRPSNKIEIENFNKKVILYATDLTLKTSQRISNDVKSQLIDLKKYCEGDLDIDNINKYITKNTRQQLNRTVKKMNVKIDNLAIDKMEVL